jgi:ribosomal protein S18 acetylase RimI-like enzyme
VSLLNDPMNIIVNEATETDIPGIQALAEVFFRQDYAAHHDETYITRFLSRVYSEASLRRAVQGEGTMFLIAHDGDSIVGLCNFGSPLLDDCKERNEIYRLFVHPQQCRQGLGGKLIAETVKRLARTGIINECVVYVRNDDTVRQNFYQKYKFQHDASRDKDGEWCMARNI